MYCMVLALAYPGVLIRNELKPSLRELAMSHFGRDEVDCDLAFI